MRQVPPRNGSAEKHMPKLSQHTGRMGRARPSRETSDLYSRPCRAPAIQTHDAICCWDSGDVRRSKGAQNNSNFPPRVPQDWDVARTGLQPETTGVWMAT